MFLKLFEVMEKIISETMRSLQDKVIPAREKLDDHQYAPKIDDFRPGSEELNGFQPETSSLSNEENSVERLDDNQPFQEPSGVSQNSTTGYKEKITPPPLDEVANDDRPNYAWLLEGLRERTSWQLFLASFCTIGVVLGLFFMNLHNNFVANVSNGVSFGWITSILEGALLLCVGGVVYSWRKEALASKNLMHRLLSSLLEPETLTTDALRTVSKVVRREIAAISESLERMMNRSEHIDISIKHELTALEQSFQENESRMQRMLHNLRSEREKIDCVLNGNTLHQSKSQPDGESENSQLLLAQYPIESEHYDATLQSNRISAVESALRGLGETLTQGFESFETTLRTLASDALRREPSLERDSSHLVLKDSTELSEKLEPVISRLTHIETTLERLIATAHHNLELSTGTSTKEDGRFIVSSGTLHMERSQAGITHLESQLEQLEQRLVNYEVVLFDKVNTLFAECDHSLLNTSSQMIVTLDQRIKEIHARFQMMSERLEVVLQKQDSVAHSVEHMVGNVLTGFEPMLNRLCERMSTVSQQVKSDLSAHVSELSQEFEETLINFDENSQAKCSRILDGFNFVKTQLFQTLDKKIDAFEKQVSLGVTTINDRLSPQLSALSTLFDRHKEDANNAHELLVERFKLVVQTLRQEMVRQWEQTIQDFPKLVESMQNYCETHFFERFAQQAERVIGASKDFIAYQENLQESIVQLKELQDRTQEQFTHVFKDSEEQYMRTSEELSSAFQRTLEFGLKDFQSNIESIQSHYLKALADERKQLESHMLHDQDDFFDRVQKTLFATHEDLQNKLSLVTEQQEALQSALKTASEQISTQYQDVASQTRNHLDSLVEDQQTQLQHMLTCVFGSKTSSLIDALQQHQHQLGEQLRVAIESTQRIYDEVKAKTDDSVKHNEHVLSATVQNYQTLFETMHETLTTYVQSTEKELSTALKSSMEQFQSALDAQHVKMGDTTSRHCNTVSNLLETYVEQMRDTVDDPVTSLIVTLNRNSQTISQLVTENMPQLFSYGDQTKELYALMQNYIEHISLAKDQLKQTIENTKGTYEVEVLKPIKSIEQFNHNFAQDVGALTHSLESVRGSIEKTLSSVHDYVQQAHYDSQHVLKSCEENVNSFEHYSKLIHAQIERMSSVLSAEHQTTEQTIEQKITLLKNVITTLGDLEHRFSRYFVDNVKTLDQAHLKINQEVLHLDSAASRLKKGLVDDVQNVERRMLDIQKDLKDHASDAARLVQSQTHHSGEDFQEMLMRTSRQMLKLFDESTQHFRELLTELTEQLKEVESREIQHGMAQIEASSQIQPPKFDSDRSTKGRTQDSPDVKGSSLIQGEQLQRVEEGNSSHGWVSELLTRVTTNDDGYDRSGMDASAQGQQNNYREFILTITKHLDIFFNEQELEDYWYSYYKHNGSSQVALSRLYTPQGKKIIERARTFYQNDPSFRTLIDDYIHDFRQHYEQHSMRSNGLSESLNLLLTPSGKAYTLFIHAVDRYWNADLLEAM